MEASKMTLRNVCMIILAIHQRSSSFFTVQVKFSCDETVVEMQVPGQSGSFVKTPMPNLPCSSYGDLQAAGHERMTEKLQEAVISISGTV
jgi:hypothetical protein